MSSTIEEKLSLLESKIEKVKSDRASIINAIIRKGIKVPSDAVLEDLPAYIMQITGGEEPDTSYVIGQILYIIENVDSFYENETLTIKSGASISDSVLTIN